MTPQRRFCLFACLLFLTVTILPAYGREAPLNGFDDAIAIVKDDRVVLAKIEMAEGKVMSLTLVQGSGPSVVLLPKQ
jgi:hypothetical protein